MAGSVANPLPRGARTLGGVLRAAFWLTALVFLPVGLFVYFLPGGVAAALGASPLWLARAAGGILVAWGGFLLAAGGAPDATRVGALAAGNLLTVAALVPAVLRQGAEMVPALRTALLAVSALLGLLAVVALLNPPRRKL